MKITFCGIVSAIFTVICFTMAGVASDQNIVWQPIWFVRISISTVLIIAGLLFVGFLLHNIQRRKEWARRAYLRINSVYHDNGYEYGTSWVPFIGRWAFVISPTLPLLFWGCGLLTAMLFR